MGYLSRHFVALALGVVTALVGAAHAQTYFSTKAPTAVIADGKTGKILYTKNGDTQIAPASMTKLMVAAIVLEKLQRGELALDTPLDVSEKAWRTGGSKMFVLVNTQIAVENLLKGLLVHSGNDAAVVIAENISGSTDEFVGLMNEKAEEWGLEKSHFTNPTGNDEPDHYMTALDIIKLSRKIWYDYPQYRYLFGIQSFEWSKIEQQNRNSLLTTFEGADGLKTGHTEEAGYSVAGTAQQGNDRRFIVVAGLDTNRDRSYEANRIMEKAFSEFATKTFFEPGEQVGDAEVFGSKTTSIPLVIDADVTYTMHRSQFEQASATVTYTGPLTAPVRKGEQVAVLKLTIPDEGTTEFPLYAGEKAPELGIISKMGLGVKLLFTPPEEPIF